MPDSRYFIRSKASELEEEFAVLERTGKTSKKIKALKRVIANMTMGVDVSCLFHRVMQCSKLPGEQVKKMINLFIVTCSPTTPDAIILAVNYLTVQANDQNPSIRAMAIKTMGYLRGSTVAETYAGVLRRGLSDNDPLVRKTAIVGIYKLFLNAPLTCRAEGLLNELQQSLNDTNMSVVASSLACLERLSKFAPELRFQISCTKALELIGNLDLCSEWYRYYIIQAQGLFTPQSLSDATAVIDALSNVLQQANAAVCVATIRAITRLLVMIREICSQEYIKSVFDKISASLLNLMCSSAEMQFCVLHDLKLLLKNFAGFVSFSPANILCTDTDKVYVKKAKIEVLQLLATASNYKSVLGELKDYSNTLQTEISQIIPLAYATVATRVSEAAGECVDELILFLDSPEEQQTISAIHALKKVLQKYKMYSKTVIPQIEDVFGEFCDTNAITSLAWIFGAFLDEFSLPQQSLESMCKCFANQSSTAQSCILTTTARAVAWEIPQSRQVFNELLIVAAQNHIDDDVQARAIYLDNLIKHDCQYAKTVLTDKNDPFNVENKFIESCVGKSIGMLPSSMRQVATVVRSRQLAMRAPPMSGSFATGPVISMASQVEDKNRWVNGGFNGLDLLENIQRSLTLKADNRISEISATTPHLASLQIGYQRLTTPTKTRYSTEIKLECVDAYVNEYTKCECTGTVGLQIAAKLARECGQCVLSFIIQNTRPEKRENIRLTIERNGLGLEFLADQVPISLIAGYSTVNMQVPLLINENETINSHQLALGAKCGHETEQYALQVPLRQLVYRLEQVVEPDAFGPEQMRKDAFEPEKIRKDAFEPEQILKMPATRRIMLFLCMDKLHLHLKELGFAHVGIVENMHYFAAQLATFHRVAVVSSPENSQTRVPLSISILIASEKEYIMDPLAEHLISLNQ